MKKIGIIGSTGSIGTQALKIIKDNPDMYEVSFLTAGSNIDLLTTQATQFKVENIALFDNTKINDSNMGIKNGLDGIVDVIESSESDLIISSIVGFAGVVPTYAALKTGTDVALANKESLVSAGELITQTAEHYNANLIAVDSEHSAILQSLAGEDFAAVEKLILTASGGPFRNLPKEDFKNIKLEDALKHPNWEMGSKITIDSATLMNKGLEVIEAKWLFDFPHDKIDVLVHPQSIIHSMVQFRDGSIKAQLGVPDMAVPIAYAMSYPDRITLPDNRIDWNYMKCLDFDEPDYDRFPCLKTAFLALEYGSGYCNAMNAANEVAVHSFLNKEINFIDIHTVIDKVLQERAWDNVSTLETVIHCDKEARKLAKKFISESLND